MEIQWPNLTTLPGVDYQCGYCGREVSASAGLAAPNPARGIPGAVPQLWICICPRCSNPTYLKGGLQVPGPSFGEDVSGLPDDVGRLYQEARSSASENNFTAATLVSRKVLMNVAVAKGAAENQSFQQYVDYLVEGGVITSDMRPWVDEIRKLGNEATHEIKSITREQAEDLITFLGMLLKIVYEYPARHAAAMAARQEAPPPA